MCSECGHENPDEARFCNGCGRALLPVCPSCEAENPAGARFCNRCGSALGENPPAPDPDPREFTPQHLADKILTTRSTIEGERKHVTVVFMDVVGFTALAEPADPEQVRTIINRCMETILEAVHRFEGTVNQFTGDGVMALFGAPIALEDAPRRAVSAALAVQRALEPLRREVRESLGTDFQMRVGIHSGNVVVGSIGNDLRMEYTAVGDTTNLAARLEQLASPGAVLISEAMQRQVAPFFELRDLGHVRVKGRQAPVRVFEVEDEYQTRGRLEAESRAGLTEFVGRKRELDLLIDAFDSVRDGRGQIVFLVGDAGIGKSRLLYEFHRHLAREARDEHYWMEGRCSSFGQNTAFGPIVDALRRAYRIDPSDDDASMLDKVRAVEAQIGEDLAWTRPYMRRLMSLPASDEDATLDELDPRARRSEMQRALEARFLRAASERPLVYILEDLHWIDTASEEILTALAEVIPSNRVLLILTHRPGYAQPLGDRSYHTRVALQALSERETATMASALLRTADSEAALHQLIADKAEGNPFFIEELTRSLVDSEQIRIDGERAALVGDLSDLRVPDRVQDVLAARIDRLDEEPKRAIQVASVIGREFALRLLDRISEAQQALETIVEELRTLELVYQKAAFPEAVFTFKHALTHDVAYESVLHQRRKEIHRAAGAAIEELYADRLTEHYEALAHHFSRGEAWERALHFHDLAARKAADAYANRAAVEHLRAALAIAERLGDRVSKAQREQFAARLGEAYSVASEFRASCEAYSLAAELSDDPTNRSRYLHSAALWALWSHDYVGAQRYRDRGSEAAKASGRETEEARAMLIAAFSHVVTRGTEGVRTEDTEKILVQSEADEELCSMSQTMLGEAVDWCGDFPRSLRLQENAIEIARRRRSPYLTIISAWFIGKAACCMGDYGRALRDLREQVEFCERIGDRAFQTRLLNTLGWALAETGRDDRALRFNQKSTELAEEMVKLGLVPGAPEIYGNAAVNLACNRIAMGELAAGEDQLASVRESFRADDDPWMRWRYSMHIQDAMGRLVLAQGQPDATLEWTDGELVTARAHGARKLEARALELRGRALLVMDQRDDAREALADAHRIASAIGYPPVLWRSESLLGELARRIGDRAESERWVVQAQERIAALSVPTLEDEARQGLDRLRERLRDDPMGAYR